MYNGMDLVTDFQFKKRRNRHCLQELFIIMMDITLINTKYLKYAL